jgi:hypothetical protein
MTRERVENAISVINYAIQNNITVSEASTQKGYASTYVKNTKMVLLEKQKEGEVDEELFSLFMDKYTEYEESKKSNDNVVTNEIVDGKKQEKPVIGEKTSLNVQGKTATVNWIGDKESFDETFNPGNEYIEDEEYDDGFHYGYPEGHITTLDQLLEKCQVDQNIWEVVDFTVNKWDVTMKVDGKPRTWENFQVKARLKLKEAQAKAVSAAEIFRQMTKDYEAPVIDFEVCSGMDVDDGENNVLEICLFDLHYGKLAWNGETGENYDTKIARTRFIYALTKLIKRSKAFPFKRVLFPIGNDFFNSDTILNTTTQGTQQDEDLRWQKTFKSGCELLIDGINILKKLGVPIDVLIIPGNHDFERSFYMGSFLEAWFRGDDLVKVDNGANPRKYYRWGKVLIGFTHGKDEAENSLAMLMAKDKESKKHWSDTDFHEWHLGHFHRKKTKKFTVLDKSNFVNEEDGVIVRYLSSLTGTEEWHFKKGFVGQIKAGEAFIWSDKLGMIGHVNSNYMFEGDVEEKNNVEDLINM